MRTLIVASLLFAAAAGGGCKRHAPAPPKPRDLVDEGSALGKDESEKPDNATPPKDRTRTSRRSRVITVAWYDVPDNSLAKRRAPPGEFTAANDRLPLGSLLRVTRPDSGKSVVVRITDRGVHHRGVKLDVCKEAADALGFTEQGLAKLRVEPIDEAQKTAGKPSAQSGAQP